MLNPIQNFRMVSATPVPSLPHAFGGSNPAFQVGSYVVVAMKFGPLTGIPTIESPTNTPLRLCGTIQVGDAGTEWGFWVSDVIVTTPGNITIFAVGGNQTFDALVQELSPVPPPPTVAALMQVEQQQVTLLQKLVDNFCGVRH